MDPVKHAIPTSDASHPVWDVMKAALTDKGVPSEHAMAQGVANHKPPVQPAPIQGAIPQGMEDGGYVHSREVINGVPSYNVGRPGLGGAIQDLVEHFTHGGMKGAQDTARRETQQRVDSNVEGHAVPGYEEGGPVPTGVTGVLDAMNTGSEIGKRTYDAQHAFQGEEEAKAANTAHVQGAFGDDPEAAAAPADSKPGAIMTAIEHPITAVRGAVNKMAKFLGINSHDSTDDGKDKGVDSSTAPAAVNAGGNAVPADSKEAAVVQGASGTAAPSNPDAAAAAVKPSATPVTKPQTLGPDFYEQIHNHAVHAAYLAAKAGLDPDKMYNSTMAMAVSHMQGKVMRAYGDAYTAYQQGDMKGVQTALQNADYYKPNGKTLTFMHASDLRAKGETVDPSISDDTLMVRNPMLGYPGHEKDQTNIPITPQSIHLMATAALDPQNFHTELATISKAETEAMKDAAESRAKVETADAAMARAHSYNTKADAYASQTKVLNWLHGEEAGYYHRKSGTTGKNSSDISLSQVRAVSNDAQNAVDDMALGQPTVVPTTNADGSTNLSPAAGKTIRDPSKVPTDFKGYPPDSLVQIKNLAANVAAANSKDTKNGKGVSRTEAALIASKIYQYKAGFQYDAQQGKLVKTGPETGRHLVPGTKAPNAKFERNVIQGVGDDEGIYHVWMGDGWRDVRMNYNVTDDAGMGPASRMGGGGDSAIPSDDVAPEDQAADSGAGQ